MGRFLGYTAFGSLTFGLVCGQLGVMCLGTGICGDILGGNRRLRFVPVVVLGLLVVNGLLSLFLQMMVHRPLRRHKKLRAIPFGEGGWPGGQ